MRLVRFHRRSFVDGHLYEAGEEALIDERNVLGPHMQDVETGVFGAAGEPGVDPHIERLSHPEREQVAEQNSTLSDATQANTVV